jgi:GH15 family glucan-1,4-alpha-glucosidase
VSQLELGVVGNCAFGALINSNGRVVWCCLPRFDSDPVFHSLLGAPAKAQGAGEFAIELEDLKHSEQSYEPNTALLRTRLEGAGGAIEIVDFAPRFNMRGRMFRPTMLVRRVRPLSGRPRVRIRLQPRFGYGAHRPQLTTGSNHMRFVGPSLALRLTTDAPVDYIVDETLFLLDQSVDLIFGPDETLSESPREMARLFEERTIDYWRTWCHRLALPYEWQEAVIRAAITLKLCTYEPTGAIVAALTTSIPEAPNSGRNWDYRYCWLRDSFFVVRALNSLATVATMENYFNWLMNVISSVEDSSLQPVYGVGLEKSLPERIVKTLPGYRGMGPVRIGNQAYEHRQHDAYGSVILGTTQTFIDQRLFRRATIDDFARLETVGEQCFRLYREPDAGIWEYRSRARIHTPSSLMCWAGCDRLSKLANHLGMQEKFHFWAQRANVIKSTILREAWNQQRGSFVDCFGGKDLDASVLLMTEVGFIAAEDPRFVSTVAQIEKNLMRGRLIMRYEAPDDFGSPQTAFNICAFWYLDALARQGRREEARAMFVTLLNSRNRLGLLSEDLDPVSGEPWGNYPQTYSMVGIINGAMRLSRPWETVV